MAPNPASGGAARVMRGGVYVNELVLSFGETIAILAMTCPSTPTRSKPEVSLADYEQRPRSRAALRPSPRRWPEIKRRREAEARDPEEYARCRATYPGADNPPQRALHRHMTPTQRVPR
jgi:hypothetical protein